MHISKNVFIKSITQDAVREGDDKVIVSNTAFTLAKKYHVTVTSHYVRLQWPLPLLSLNVALQ